MAKVNNEKTLQQKISAISITIGALSGAYQAACSATAVDEVIFVDICTEREELLIQLNEQVKLLRQLVESDG